MGRADGGARHVDGLEQGVEDPLDDSLTLFQGRKQGRICT
jgi:hypothetical protein